LVDFNFREGVIEMGKGKDAAGFLAGLSMLASGAVSNQVADKCDTTGNTSNECQSAREVSIDVPKEADYNEPHVQEK
jgi:hypothetical protein